MTIQMKNLKFKYKVNIQCKNDESKIHFNTCLSRQKYRDLIICYKTATNLS